MPLPHVIRGTQIESGEQNALIDQVNENTVAIATLGGGNPLDIQEMIDSTLAVHVNAREPHPAYDADIPSLTVLFENGLA